MTKHSVKPKSTLLIASKSVPLQVNIPEGVEETEIAAEISVPTEGGWGWIVVLASFLCFFILDGAFFTFGSLFRNITDEMNVEGTLIALVNSVAIALYFMCGPIVSALTNRFGFRACTMTGSIVLYTAYLCSYFVTGYGALLLFYGIVAGFGACLVLVPSSVVVGFYFERYRAIALALSGLGSSVGIMIMFTVNSYFVQISDWRTVTLFHAGLFGIIYFIGMAYRPLLVVKLTQTTESNDPTRTITYLPSITPAVSATRSRRDVIQLTAGERLFSAVSNRNFPTATAVVQEGTHLPSSQPGPSLQPISRVTVSPRNTGSVSHKHLSKLQSVLLFQNNNVSIEVSKDEQRINQKRKWWSMLCCKWEEHVPESRPMYRDDAFYAGNIEKLPVYQKSVREVQPERRTGLEYQMAVSRAVTTADLEEHKGIFTTAARRVLATMIDPTLLKSLPFLLICCSATLTYSGSLTPFIFVSDRAKSEGVKEYHCNFFVSVIGLSGILGRIIAGIFASRYSCLFLYLISCICAGLSTIAFNYSFSVYYQYFCCASFGFFIAFASGIRSMVLVETFGLEKLTNATGIMLMFQGFGSFISTPMSSILKSTFNYAVSFYVAGIVIVMSGIVLLPVKTLIDKERSSELPKNSRTG